MLEALGEAGILGIERREGNRRVYDLAERLFPAELLAQHRPEREQLRHKLLSRYRGNGLLGVSGDYSIWAGTGDAADAGVAPRELVATGAIVPVDVEGLQGPRFVVGDEVPLLDAAEAEAAAGRPDARAPAPRSWLRSTRWPGTGTCCSACGGSTTGGRSTSRPRSAAGATTCCRCSTATGSSGASSRGSTAGPGPCASSGCGGRTGSSPCPTANPGFVDAFTEAIRAHMAFADLAKLAMPRVVRHREIAAAVRASL